MDDRPFHLRIERDSPPGTEQLTCVALLRAVPDKRCVYDAVWNDRPVIVKIFTSRFRARRHLRREWRGLDELHDRGIDAPVGLFHGRTEKGDWAVVIEKIIDAQSLRESLITHCNSPLALEHTLRLCRELARCHDKGVLQTDPNLNNFLVQGGRIVSIDPGQIRFQSRPIDRNRSLSQLAEFLSGLPADHRPPTGRMLDEYLQVRGWPRRPADEATLETLMRRDKRRAIERMLRKYQRENSKHVQVRVQGWQGLVDRAFCEGADPVEFVRRLDDLMKQGKALKIGNTSQVCRTVWNGRQIVIKRYNHKGAIHSLRHAVKMSRARRSWIHGHRLRFLGVSTPEPLACIERWRGLLVWCSYIVTEYVAGCRLDHFLCDEAVSTEDRREQMEQVENLLGRLHDCGISHGDMKHSNILIGPDGPVLTDLDAITVHRWRWTSRIAHRKDWERLAAS